jgi:serine/threonine protein kinase
MVSSHGGTTHYRAPELVAHQRYRNPVDIWALGVVGLQYLETLPDEDDTTEAEYTRRVSDHARRLARQDPSSGHRRLLSQMLHMASTERPSTLACFEAIANLVAA